MKAPEQSLTAEQVRATIAASGLSHLAFAERIGCGTSQLFKYQKEGLPPRMNRPVRAGILEMAARTSILPANAAVRETVRKLSRGKRPTPDEHKRRSHEFIHHDVH